MIDERERYERAFRQFQMTEPAWEILVDRRDRKRRNQRIAAGVVGIAVFVAAVWVPGIRVGQDTTTPADRPTGNPGRKSPEDVATDFVYETAFFDTDLAVRHLVNASRVPNDAAVSGLGLDGIGEFRRWLSYNEATGFQIIPTSCAKTGSSSRGTYVRCTFDFHGIRSEAIGRGPYSGSYFDLLVAHPIAEMGRILDVSAYLEIAKFGPQMWDPFDDWVSTNYPEDAAVMYNTDHTEYQLSKESIRLWEQHTREYVETGPAETGAENREPLPVVEPVQIGTVTQSGAGCALALDAGPIPSGAGRISVVNETNRRVSFNLYRLRSSSFFAQFEAFIAEAEFLGGPLAQDPPGAFLLVQRDVGPSASGTITDNFTTGAFAVVCLDYHPSLDILPDYAPFAVVGPIVVP